MSAPATTSLPFSSGRRALKMLLVRLHGGLRGHLGCHFLKHIKLGECLEASYSIAIKPMRLLKRFHGRGCS